MIKLETHNKFRHSVLKVFLKGSKPTANYFRFILEVKLYGLVYLKNVTIL